MGGCKVRSLERLKPDRKMKKLPADDSPRSVRKRAWRVNNGIYPEMPGLSRMTRAQMAKQLNSLWSFMDEVGVQRRNETAPNVELSLYGRVCALWRHGPVVKGL